MKPQTVDLKNIDINSQYLSVVFEGQFLDNEIHVLFSLKPYGPGFKIIKPFKEELKALTRKDFDLEWFGGHKKAVKLQKVSAPYVDLEKLKANTKDYKKYVSYRTQYRLTATDNKLAIKEVA